MRPVVFDTTHLIARQGIKTPTGIDRVDHAYATEFSNSRNLAAGVQVALPRPRKISPERVQFYADQLSKGWGETKNLAEDGAFNTWHHFVSKQPQLLAGSNDKLQSPPKPSLGKLWGRRLLLVKRLFENDSTVLIPEGALFLNVTQNPTLIPRAGRFLQKRPDLKAVFLVHDLIPIDHPEFFPVGRKRAFDKVLNVILRHASALITTSNSVRDRLVAEMKTRNMALLPILVAPLPVSPGFEQQGAIKSEYANARYVVMVGTIEPRKNHWLMLQLWRRMIRDGDDPPQLVIAGANGWGADAIYDLLERTPDFKGRVLYVNGLSNQGLRQVIGHARALLIPSFIEGYGIPVVEAATLGTPVISGNHRVFKEVSQGCAIAVDPIDGPGWRKEILSLAGPKSQERHTAIKPLKGFVPPLNEAYFERVRAFLAEI